MIIKMVKKFILQYQANLFFESFKFCILENKIEASTLIDVCGGSGYFSSYVRDKCHIISSTFDKTSPDFRSSHDDFIVGDVLNYDFGDFRDKYEIVALNNSWQLFSDHQWFESLISNCRPEYVFLSCPSDSTLKSLQSAGYTENFIDSNFNSAVASLAKCGFKSVCTGYCGGSNYITSPFRFVFHVFLFKLLGRAKFQGVTYSYGLFMRA